MAFTRLQLCEGTETEDRPNHQNFRKPWWHALLILSISIRRSIAQQPYTNTIYKSHPLSISLPHSSPEEKRRNSDPYKSRQQKKDIIINHHLPKLSRSLSNQTRYSESQIQHFLQLNQTDDARNARSLHEYDDFNPLCMLVSRFMQLEGRPNQTFVRFPAFVFRCTTRPRYDAEVCMR